MLESGSLTIGVNYWASHAATAMWRNWQPEVIEHDFALFAQYNMTLVRLFPLWNDFQPIREIHQANGFCSYSAPYDTRIFEDERHLPDTAAGYAGIDETMMERFEIVCDIGEKYGLSIIPCLLTGHMTSRLFIPPALENRDLYSDPVALKWEKRFIDYFVRRMKHHPAIFAWESGNESQCLGPISGKEHAEFWLNFIHDAIRVADPSRPIIGVNGLCLNSHQDPWGSLMNAHCSDFVTVHPYNMWSKAGIEEFNGVRNLLYCTAQCSALSQATGKPAFVEETGLWRPMAVSLDGLAKYQRGLLWNLWAADCRGMLWWCAFDQDRFDFAPYDWGGPGLEHGLFTAERIPHPGAKALADFGKFIHSLPFKTLPKANADVQIITGDSDRVHSSYILSRQAGLIPEYQSPETAIKDASVYILPSAAGRNLLSTRNWEALLQKVHNGATLLLVWNDTYLTHLNEVCGVEVLSRKENTSTMEYQFDGFSVTLPQPVQVEFHPITAQVLGWESTGKPCFFVNSYGKGRVFTLGFPLEQLVYSTPGLYHSDAWRIYGLVCPKQPILSVQSPFITVSVHPFSEDKVVAILVNNSTQPFEGKVELAQPWEIHSVHTDCPQVASFHKNVLTLDCNAGILFILEKHF